MLLWDGSGAGRGSGSARPDRATPPAHLDGRADRDGGCGRGAQDGRRRNKSPSYRAVARPRTPRLCADAAARHRVGATGLEPAVSCSQSRRASHYATPRQAARCPRRGRLGRALGADDGNRTRVASLEDWGSTIELHPRGGSPRGASLPHAVRRVGNDVPDVAAQCRSGAGQRRCTSTSARSSSGDPRRATSRSAAPSTVPRSSCSACPIIRSIPRSMSRRGSSTMPSV